MEKPGLSFLQTRINNIGTALFFCNAKNILPFPAYIITALKTDDEGYIWFFIGKNWSHTEVLDTAFPATLEFYRKGYPFYIKIEGQAILSEEKQMVQHFMGKSIHLSDEALSGVLLVKVKIVDAVYKDLASPKPAKSLNGILSSVKNLWQPAHPRLQPSL